MPSPYEIMSGPIEIYHAPLATVYPIIEAAPAVAWKLVGASGSKNYTEDGVRVNQPNVMDAIRALGATGPRKFFRSSEDLIVEATVMDMTAEMVAVALGKLESDVVDTAPGPSAAGHRAITLRRGFTVKTFSLLLRQDLSPYGEDWKAQWEIPVATVVGEPDIMYVKNDAAKVLFRFQAIDDPTLGFGSYRVQDAAATP